MMHIALAILLAAVVLAGLARIFTARTGPARVDGVAVTVAALAPAAALWQWIGGVAPAAALGCVGLWFLWRVAAPAGKATPVPGGGRGTAAYRLLFSAAALWITLALQSVHEHGTGELLGNILLHTMAGVTLIFAAAAWLLGTFAMPEGSGEKIRPILGTQEAVAAIAVALCFFTLV
ncbi:hypothetical protein AL755_12620 [Arthrobacter sp. ERGS1:01]|uniref:hypothetical protein n=1 Tax=Arthrobacter sp. ERGS1:01 TaxID=1704044 RepID=UPI0006B51CF6|nr:hypothetical protein [Arthrobacter sp. ERGS1:01]ALE06117.1 hypothetical protein AL755_12620 [Arthrobacter sp. ERGS1:01]